MSWIIFYPLLGFYLYWMYRIAFKPLSLGQKTVLWVVTSIPVVAYCWGFFATQFDHYRACRDEAGLKVYVKPEKADRVRLMGIEYHKSNAYGLFQDYYPRIRSVEAITERRDHLGRRLNQYDLYTTDRMNADENQAGAVLKKSGDYSIHVYPAIDPDPSVYEISKSRTQGRNFERFDYQLTRNGVLHAKYSEFRHVWGGIEYPDAVPSWRCSEPIPLGEFLGLTARGSMRAKYGDYMLSELIFGE